MSGSRQPKARLRRVVAVVGAALAAAAILAPAASAQNFTLDECAGEGVLGRGASFQTAAHTRLERRQRLQARPSPAAAAARRPEHRSGTRPARAPAAPRSASAT